LAGLKGYAEAGPMADNRTYEISILNQEFQDVNPLTCGWEDCEPGHSYGPAAREYFLIHYILSGKGYFERGGVRYDLGSGSFFLIRPDELTYYQADDTDPWHYVWVGFIGGQINTLLENTPLQNDQAVAAAPYLNRIFGEIRSEIERQQAPELFLCARLYECFALLQGSRAARSDNAGYVRRAVDYMKANYARPISIGGIAGLIGIDRRYFARIFAAATGQTPKQYLMNLRLERAAYYLGIRNYSVSDAARSVGYEDVFNFSKMFKRRFGLAPQHYRRSAAGLS